MKSIYLALALGISAWLGWYFLVKPYSYEISFEAKAVPGVIIQTMKTWERSLDNSTVMKPNQFGQFAHQVVIDGIYYDLVWETHRRNEVNTKVSLNIREVGDLFRNKLFVPFTKATIEVKAETLAKDFYKTLHEHLKKIHVSIEGLSQLPDSFCACVSLSGPQNSKASGMMRNYTFLSSFVANNEIKPNGVPIVEVTYWNKELDSINYNFCYPIFERDSLPESSRIFYKKLISRKAVKAIYNGNYITSDRAWYALTDYALSNDLEVIGEPIELFHNNPNFDNDELKWKAEVFLPVD